ncbi:chaperonin GroEL [Kribbella catacumbae]|uniref:chaperonin GroEL n=1 Tax=Kribbella catacumbae TaxID=460086 RepID=UPI0003709E38|nr:chaperonin GroEL [Kribbella catacumbae]
MPGTQPPGEQGRGSERGLDALADAVRVTLGPTGRDVEFEGPYENLGAKLLEQAAVRTDEAAGSGGATSIVLAQALVRDATRAVARGAHPEMLKSGIDKAVRAIVDELGAGAVSLTSKQQLAAVVSTALALGRPPGDPTDPPEDPDEDLDEAGAQVGALVAEAMDKVGKDGVITVEESDTFGLELELAHGMRFDQGYLSPYFVTDTDRTEAVLEDPYVLLTNTTISSASQLIPLLERVMGSGRPLLIVAEDVQGEAMATLVVNKIRGTFSAASVRAPSSGARRVAVLQDLAILTGGEVISGPLDTVDLELLGQARKVVVTKDETTIVGGSGDADRISGRVNQIRSEIENADTDYAREKLQQRLAKLAGGVAVIKIGAMTDTGLNKQKQRIEAAVRIARAAVEEGIVAGGGVGLLRASAAAFEKLELEGDEATGAAIVRFAVEAPLKQIAANVGLEADVVLERVRSLAPGWGLNAATGEYVDLMATGIIDPAKVSRSALQNAASFATLFLTTEAATADRPEGTRLASSGQEDPG